MTHPRVTVPVVAALLEDADGCLLLGQRPPTKALALKWEFPGGKVEAGETPLEALARELQEELGIRVTPGKAWPVFRHDYEKVTVEMHPFSCRLAPDSPPPHAHEHVGLVWVRPERLGDYDLAPADVPLVAPLQEAARARP